MLGSLLGGAAGGGGGGYGSSQDVDVFTMRDFKGGSFNQPTSLWTVAGYAAVAVGTVYALKKLKIWK